MPDRYVKATSDMCSDFCCPKDRLHPPPPPVTGCELDGHAAVCKARAHTHTPATTQEHDREKRPTETLPRPSRHATGTEAEGAPWGGPARVPSRASLSRVHDTPGTRPQTDRRSRGWNAAPRALTVLVLLTPSATRRVATYAPYAPCSSNARPPENGIHTCSRGRGPRHTAVNTSRTHML